jgi:hypothetical protein
METTYPDLRGAFAIPNGFLDSKSKRIRATQEGVLSGVPDIFIPWPKNGHHGLFLEFKKPGGRVTKAQQDYLNLMASRGYKAQVVFGLREALEVLKAYIDLQGDPQGGCQGDPLGDPQGGCQGDPLGDPQGGRQGVLPGDLQGEGAP